MARSPFPIQKLRSMAQGAGDILMKYYTRVHRVVHKPRAGIVTEADGFAEAYLLRYISRNFPNSSIITEESGEFRRESPYTWLIDPLDGTSNYAHGFPWFCVSLALYEEGEPRAAVVFNPVSKELFDAEKGKGARLNGRRLRVTAESEMRNSLLGTGFYYARGPSLRRDMELFRRVNEVALGVRRPGAAALDMACVAAGRYEGFWERGLSPWDVAAGWLLVTEAGGVVTDYRGGAYSVFGDETLATNGRVHRKMVNLLTGRRRA